MRCTRALLICALFGTANAGCNDPSADRGNPGPPSTGYNAADTDTLDCTYAEKCKLTTTVDGDGGNLGSVWPRGDAVIAECGIGSGSCSDTNFASAALCELNNKVWTPGWTEDDLPVLPVEMPCFYRQYRPNEDGGASPVAGNFFASCDNPAAQCATYEALSDCLLTVSSTNVNGLPICDDASVLGMLGFISQSQIDFTTQPTCISGTSPCTSPLVAVDKSDEQYPLELYSESAYIGYLFHVSQSGTYTIDFKYRLDTVGQTTVPVKFLVNGAMYFADPACYEDTYTWNQQNPCPASPAPYARENGVDVEQTRFLNLKSASTAAGIVTLSLSGIALRYYDNDIQVQMTQANFLDLIEINVNDCLVQTSCSSSPCFSFPQGSLNAGSQLICHTNNTSPVCDATCPEEDQLPYCCTPCSSVPGWTVPTQADGTAALCDFGTDCQDVDECMDGNNGGCQDNRPCVNMPGWNYCGACADGSNARDDTRCVDANECGQGKCGANRDCFNYDSMGVRQTCPSNTDCVQSFTGDSTPYVIAGDAAAGNQAFPDSMRIEPPLGEAGNLPVYFSSAGKPKFACLGCLPGYESRIGSTGINEQDCVDINECTVSNGGCDPLSACYNNDGGRFCGDCPIGYQGNPEETCTKIPADEVEAAKGGGIPEEHSGKWTGIIFMVVVSIGLATVAILFGFKQIIDSHELKLTELVRGKGNEVAWDKKSYAAANS